METRTKINFIIQTLKDHQYRQAEQEIASLVLAILRSLETGHITQSEALSQLKPLYNRLLELDFELKLREHLSDWIWDVLVELDVYEHYGQHDHEVPEPKCRQCMDVAAMKQCAESALVDIGATGKP